MHIHELADCCTFSEVAVGGTLPATENYRAFLKKLHPKQILNMQITIPLYRVRYSYMTRRGNIRQSEKFFFATAGEHEELALEVEMKLKDWFEDENRARPYRAVSNVEILDIDRVAYATLQRDFFLLQYANHIPLFKGYRKASGDCCAEAPKKESASGIKVHAV